MPIWKLEPVDPLDDYHWRGTRYIGPVFVRADDEISARGAAQEAFGIAAVKPPGAETPLMPWTSARLSSCETVTDTDYDEDGPEAVLGPPGAIERAHPRLA